MSDPLVIEQKRQELLALAHAMQSGVAFLQDKKDQEPKHLRVGVNNAMVECGVLAKILIDKGVISEEDYLDELIAGLKKEVEKYRNEIAAEQGVDVSRIKLA